MGRYDRFVLVRILAESDLGWFAALRPRVKSKQRAVNINASIIQRILPEELRSSEGFEVLAECVFPGGHANEVRGLSRVHKNWRLGGKAVKGDVFNQVGAGDLFVAEFNGVALPRPTLRWTIVLRHDKVEYELIHSTFEHQFEDGMVACRGDAEEYLPVNDLLDSHGKLNRLPTLRVPPAPTVAPRTESAEASFLGTQPAVVDTQPWGTALIPTSEHLPPDPGRMIQALRSMGYTFEQAIADIVDNSLAARARRVVIRLMRDDDAITRVFIADDGQGMTAERLTEAMRFGSASREDSSRRLGKFGMGMKLASLSHSSSLSVATRQANRIGGRRWTVEGITSGWECEILQPDATGKLLAEVSDAIALDDAGTVVCWDAPDRISIKDRPDAVSDKLIHRLRQHLAIHLHRFLEDGRVCIELDCQHEGTERNAVRTVVEPLNPFKYESSPDDSFPRPFRLDLAGLGPLTLEAHIWPPGLSSPNYKLDNRVVARQGFYFYRNDRLIQAGGWNGWRDTEPHLSLARVSVDLPSAYDRDFGLDVQKSSVELPPGFQAALQEARDDEGRPFKEFVQRALSIYRTKERANPDNHPLVPGAGVATALRQTVKDILVKERRRTRQVEFEWARTDPESFFTLDREKNRILLNKEWRHRILDGRRASMADAPIVKLLLFLLVRDDLDTGRVSRPQKERLDNINKILLAALRSTKHDED